MFERDVPGLALSETARSRLPYARTSCDQSCSLSLHIRCATSSAFLCVRGTSGNGTSGNGNGNICSRQPVPDAWWSYERARRS